MIFQTFRLCLHFFGCRKNCSPPWSRSQIKEPWRGQRHWGENFPQHPCPNFRKAIGAPSPQCRFASGIAILSPCAPPPIQIAIFVGEGNNNTLVPLASRSWRAPSMWKLIQERAVCRSTPTECYQPQCCLVSVVTPASSVLDASRTASLCEDATRAVVGNSPSEWKLFDIPLSGNFPHWSPTENSALVPAVWVETFLTGTRCPRGPLALWSRGTELMLSRTRRN